MQRTGYEFILDSKVIPKFYRRLLIAGYTKEQASNMIAHLMGLGPSEKGWTVKELQYLHFLNTMAAKKYK